MNRNENEIVYKNDFLHLLLKLLANLRGRTEAIFTNLLHMHGAPVRRLISRSRIVPVCTVQINLSLAVSQGNLAPLQHSIGHLSRGNYDCSRSFNNLGEFSSQSTKISYILLLLLFSCCFIREIGVFP